MLIPPVCHKVRAFLREEMRFLRQLVVLINLKREARNLLTNLLKVRKSRKLALIQPRLKHRSL